MVFGVDNICIIYLPICKAKQEKSLLCQHELELSIAKAGRKVKISIFKQIQVEVPANLNDVYHQVHVWKLETVHIWCFPSSVVMPCLFATLENLTFVLRLYPRVYRVNSACVISELQQAADSLCLSGQDTPLKFFHLEIILHSHDIHFSVNSSITQEVILQSEPSTKSNLSSTHFLISQTMCFLFKEISCGYLPSTHLWQKV